MQTNSIHNHSTLVRSKLAPKEPAVPKSSQPVEGKDNFTPSTEKSPTLREAFDKIHNAGGEAEARLLDDNAESWNARWKVLESATDTINTQYFCWDHDIFGKAMLGHIFKKASLEGVKTRIMIDATGDTLGTRGFKSHYGGRDYLQEVTALPNAEAKVYHPHYKKLIDGLLHPGKNYSAASNHDKILEVDGERAITGGRNIGYEYYVDPKDFKGAWRDTDVYIEGEASAHALRDAFEVEYNAPWINEKVRPDFLGNWVKRDIELLGAYTIMDDWLKGDPMSEADKEKLRTSETFQSKVADDVYRQALEHLPLAGATREPGRREKKRLKELAQEMIRFPELRGSYNAPESELHQSEVKILDRTSVVSTAQDEMGEQLVNLARSAQKKILIENPYIVLTKNLLSELQKAGKRGVEIQLGTNSPSSTDSAVTQAFFLEDWPKILATTPNMRLFVATGERKLHAKVGVIDEEASLVSTYNMDLLSSEVNSEVGALVWSKDFAKDTLSGFEKDFHDPRNGVQEYKILRDDKGAPIRSDGKPVLDEKGELINDPEIAYGPANHLSQEVLDKYAKKTSRWNLLREWLPNLSSLDTFEN
jgi:cardiolipin synthase C